MIDHPLATIPTAYLDLHPDYPSTTNEKVNPKFLTHNGWARPEYSRCLSNPFWLNKIFKNRLKTQVLEEWTKSCSDTTSVTPPNRPKHRSNHRPTIKQEHDRLTTHTKGWRWKASQQSNKNMTDRPTKHHGPEALRDGLGTIQSKSQNLIPNFDQFIH